MIIRRNAILRQLAEQVPFDPNTPWQDLDPKIRRLILRGDARRNFFFKLGRGRKPPEKMVFRGVIEDLERIFRITTSDGLRAKLMAFQIASGCRSCKGSRLSAYARGITVSDLSYSDFLRMSAEQGLRFVRKEVMQRDGFEAVGDAVAGLEQRLRFRNR